VVAALPDALASRYPYAAGHARRVAFFAGRLASWLEWDEVRLRGLRVGASLHDLGKVTVAESILRKRGPLDPYELAQIRTHPAAGANLISPLAPARVALPYVLYHHERWDGDGYPSGIGGDDIPVEARLLSVVDAFDAMTSLRSYRRPFPIPRALEEISECAGSQFDPQLAAAFLDAWDAGVLQRHALALA
jgi:putative two-component system response regulator